MMLRLLPVFGAALAASCQSTGAAGPSGTSSASTPMWTCSPRVELSSLWVHLSEKYDANEDGRVTREEYARGEVQFANYDRNEDGELEESDFPTDTYFNGFSHMLVGRADADEDGQVTRAEWGTFCAGFDGNGDGRTERSEVEEAMGEWTDDWPIFLLSFDQDGDGDFDDVDLALTFRDQDYDGNGALAGKEMEGWVRTNERSEIEPPAPGEAAPDFDLTLANYPDLSVGLFDSHPPRPTALIFGSYT